MKRLLSYCVLLLSLSGLAQAIPIFDITTPTKEITLVPGGTGTVTYTIENRINANLNNMEYTSPTLASRSGGTCGTTLAQGANCTVELTVRAPDSVPASGHILLDPLRVCVIQRNLVCSVANRANRVVLNVNNMDGISGQMTQVLPRNLAEGNPASFSMTYTNGNQGVATGVSVTLPTETGLVIDSNSCGTAATPVTLPISGNCVVNATYTPPIGATGARSFTTTLSYDQGADVPLETSTNVKTIAISGQMTQVLPRNLAEGNPASFSMTYTNGNQGVATGVSVTLPTETGLVIDSNSCGTAATPVTLPISGNCVVNATYTPPIGATGARSFTTTLSYDQGADVPLETSTNVKTIAISGQVTQALPSNLAEGNPASFSMTYTNGDQGAATRVSVALPTETGLVIDSNSCGTAATPVTLPISGNCVVNATYTPPIGATGARSFTTTLSYDQGADVPLETSTNVKTIAISGQVTQALPSNLAEGNPASFSMTYTNGDQGAATRVSVALPTETGLVIDSNSCGTAATPVTLPISGNCVVNATYTPPIGATGARSFTTTLSYDQGADVPLETSTNVKTIAISGQVTQALPSNLAEGNPASFSMTYTNGNQGVATGVSVTLPTETGLVIDSNSCGTAATPVTLPISGNCVVNATYTPPIGATGARSFTTTLSYDQGADVPLETNTIVDITIIKYTVIGTGGTILTSPDGVTWARRAVGVTDEFLTDVLYANNQYVVIGLGGTILTSPNGAIWSSRTSGVTGALANISYANNQYLVVGSQASMLTSSDGISWTETNISGRFTSVVYANNQYVAVGAIGDIVTSPDGVNWTPQFSRSTQNLVKVLYANNQYVVIGFRGTILTSPNGTIWSSRTSRSVQNLYDFIYANNQYVVVGDNGTIVTSSDGVNWTPQVSGSGVSLNSIIYVNNQYMVVGAAEAGIGTILTSQDGITWTRQTRGVPNANLTKVIYANNQYVVVGNNGTIVTSTDGANWIARVSGVTELLNDIIFD